MSVKNINGQNFKDQITGMADGISAEDIEAATTHRNNVSNPHQVSKLQVGLSNADNTEDIDKPISTAVADALLLLVQKDGTKVLTDNNFSDTDKTKLDDYSPSMSKGASEVVLSGYVEPANFVKIQSGDSVASAIGNLERKIDTTRNELGESNVKSNWNEVDSLSDSYILNKPITISLQQSQDIIDTKNKKHSHINISTLDLLTTTDSKLYFDGNEVGYDANSTVTVVDGFVSQSTVDASSAKNATVLKGQINTLSTQVDDFSNHTNNTSNPHNVSKSQVGLGNVSNTSDADKPLSIAQQSALNSKVDKDGTKVLSDENFTEAMKNKLDGLDGGSGDDIILSGYNKGVSSSDVASTDTINSAFGKIENKIDEIDTNATIVKSDWNQVNTEHDAYIQNKPNTITAEQTQSITYSKTHSLATNNPHSVTKAQVGLGEVENTSDLNKPISTATSTALGTKVDKVAGKGLSKNDYTTVDRDKLSGVENDANNYSHPITDGNKHLPTGGTENQIVTKNASGDAVWSSPAVQNTGMQSSVYDTNDSGVVDNAEKVNDKTVESNVPANASFTDTVYTHPATSGFKHVPTGGVSGNILTWSENGTAIWSSVNSGDMNKATYDTNDDGIVDDSALVNGLSVQTAVPSGALFTDTVYSHPSDTGNRHIPIGGSSNKVLLWDSDGVAVWGDVAGSGDMVKSTYDTNDNGVIDNSEKVNNKTVESNVPSGAVFTDTVYTHPIVTGSKHIPAGGQSGNVLLWGSDGVATWANLTGTGDMLKSTYDTNDSGTIDNADKVNNLTVETAVPSGAVFTDTVYTHPITTGNIHLPSGGQSGDTLTWSSDGTGSWTGGVGTGDMSKGTYDTNDNGKVDNADKVNGLTVETAVPPSALFTDTVYSHPTSTGSKHIPSGGSSGNILSWDSDGVAIWSSPTGTGDMLKGTYDTDNSGIVDDAERVNNHTVESNVPSAALFTDTVYTHPSLSGSKHIPSGGASGDFLGWNADGVATWQSIGGGGNMLKSVYDTGNTGVVDQAVDAQTVGGFSIGIDVPFNAIFTDTTYIVQNGGLSEWNLSTALRNSYDGKEDGLGNPDVDNKVLSSLANGTRSWVEVSSGGGTGATTTLDTTNFDKGLSNADTNVQLAFDTIDETLGDIDTALASILGREM